MLCLGPLGESLSSLDVIWIQQTFNVFKHQRKSKIMLFYTSVSATLTIQ